MLFLNVVVMLIGVPMMIQTAMVKLMIFNLECFIQPIALTFEPILDDGDSSWWQKFVNIVVVATSI